MGSPVRGSHWSITINNPTDGDREAIENPPSFVKKVILQDEEGGKQGTLHIQAYVNTAQVRVAQVKSWLKRAHIEIARDKNALMKYVQKSETSVPGTQKVIETEYLTMDKALMKLAAISQTYPSDRDMERYMDMSPAEQVRADKAEFWRLVRIVLECEPRQVGLFTNPQLERAWLNTSSVWMKLNSKTSDIDAPQECPPSPSPSPA